jgi:hypothetical protein
MWWKNVPLSRLQSTLLYSSTVLYSFVYNFNFFIRWWNCTVEEEDGFFANFPWIAIYTLYIIDEIANRDHGWNDSSNCDTTAWWRY